MPIGIYKRIKGINFFPEKQCRNGFKKGHPDYGGFRFQKGNTFGFQKGIHIIDYLHPSWKGDEVGISGAHLWLLRNYGNPEKCEDCDKIGERINRCWNIDWSNKDHTYLRVREDYTGRCRSCHTKYDRQFNNRNFT